eukprot:424627_1
MYWLLIIYHILHITPAHPLSFCSSHPVCAALGIAVKACCPMDIGVMLKCCYQTLSPTNTPIKSPSLRPNLNPIVTPSNKRKLPTNKHSSHTWKKKPPTNKHSSHRWKKKPSVTTSISPTKYSSQLQSLSPSSYPFNHSSNPTISLVHLKKKKKSATNNPSCNKKKKKKKKIYPKNKPN